MVPSGATAGAAFSAARWVPQSAVGGTAVALGGSRAQGTHRPDSDWDFAIYYRDQFDPQELRDLGWPGEVSEVGGWGGGVFNGGAWLTIDGRRADVHYRDLVSVEHELAEAQAGRFRIDASRLPGATLTSCVP